MGTLLTCPSHKYFIILQLTAQNCNEVGNYVSFSIINEKKCDYEAIDMTANLYYMQQTLIAMRLHVYLFRALWIFFIVGWIRS